MAYFYNWQAPTQNPYSFMNRQPSNFNFNRSRYVENKSYELLNPSDTQYWNNTLIQSRPTNQGYYQYPVQYSSNTSNQPYVGQSLMDLSYSGLGNQQGSYYQSNQYGYPYGSNQTNDNYNLAIRNYYPNQDVNANHQNNHQHNHQQHQHAHNHQHNLNKNNNTSKNNASTGEEIRLKVQSSSHLLSTHENQKNSHLQPSSKAYPENSNFKSGSNYLVKEDKSRNQSKTHLADKRKQAIMKSTTNNIPVRNHNLVQSKDNLHKNESSTQLRRENTRELYRDKHYQSKEKKAMTDNSSFIIQPTSIMVKPNQYQKVDANKNVHYSKEINNNANNLNTNTKSSVDTVSNIHPNKNKSVYNRYYDDYYSNYNNFSSHALNDKHQQRYQSHMALNTIMATSGNNENSNHTHLKPASILKENIDERYKNNSMNNLDQVQSLAQPIQAVQNKPRFIPPNPEELLKPTLRGIPFDLEVNDFDDDWNPLVQQRSVSVVVNKNVEKLRNEVDVLERKLDHIQSKIKHKQTRIQGKSRENLLDGNLDNLVKQKSYNIPSVINEESQSYHPSSRLIIREKKPSQPSTNLTPNKKSVNHLNKFSQSVLAMPSHINNNEKQGINNRHVNKSKESLFIKPKRFQSPPTIVDETTTDTSTIIEQKQSERVNKYGTVASIYDVPLPSDNDAVSEYSSFVNNVFNKALNR